MLPAAGLPRTVCQSYDAFVNPGSRTQQQEGAPHGLTATMQDRINADLLAFLRARA